jgi:ParB-like chromosome segregation protein Spo0J
MPSIKAISQGRSDVYMVKPAILKTKDGWNNRDMDDPENIAHIDSLAQSIAEKGVEEPLRIYKQDDEFFIENGHMRQAACAVAVEKYGADPEMTVPVRISPATATEADRIMSQITLNSGKTFTPLEQGVVFHKLIAEGLSASVIGKQAGCTRVYVNQLVALVQAPKAMLDMVKNGTASATLAIQILKANDNDGKAAVKDMKLGLKEANKTGADRVTMKHIRKAKGEPMNPKKSASVDIGEGGETEGEGGGSSGGLTNNKTERAPSKLDEVQKILKTAMTTVQDEEDGGVSIVIGTEDWKSLVDLLELKKRDDNKDLI